MAVVFDRIFEGADIEGEQEQEQDQAGAPPVAAVAAAAAAMAVAVIHDLVQSDDEDQEQEQEEEEEEEEQQPPPAKQAKHRHFMLQAPQEYRDTHPARDLLVYRVQDDMVPLPAPNTKVPKARHVADTSAAAQKMAQRVLEATIAMSSTGAMPSCAAMDKWPLADLSAYALPLGTKTPLQTIASALAQTVQFDGSYDAWEIASDKFAEKPSRVDVLACATEIATLARQAAMAPEDRAQHESATIDKLQRVLVGDDISKPRTTKLTWVTQAAVRNGLNYVMAAVFRSMQQMWYLSEGSIDRMFAVNRRATIATLAGPINDPVRATAVTGMYQWMFGIAKGANEPLRVLQRLTGKMDSPPFPHTPLFNNIFMAVAATATKFVATTMNTLRSHAAKPVDECGDACLIAFLAERHPIKVLAEAETLAELARTLGWSAELLERHPLVRIMKHTGVADLGGAIANRTLTRPLLTMGDTNAIRVLQLALQPWDPTRSSAQAYQLASELATFALRNIASINSWYAFGAIHLFKEQPALLLAAATKGLIGKTKPLAMGERFGLPNVSFDVLLVVDIVREETEGFTNVAPDMKQALSAVAAASGSLVLDLHAASRLQGGKFAMMLAPATAFLQFLSDEAAGRAQFNVRV